MEKIVIITGGSSGIGHAAAQVLAGKGCRVYGFSRSESPADAVIHIRADVTREEQVQAAVEEVLKREGRIDVVINNAGFGISAEAAGAFVARKALQRKVPVLCTLGGKYKLFVFLTRLLPARMLVYLVGKIYAS